MKILTAQQTRETDTYTIINEPITSIDLMERASHAFVNSFLATYTKETAVLVIAGLGNNGADALAIARILHKKYFNVTVFLASPDQRGSINYQINLKSLPSSIKRTKTIETSTNKSVIIDGLLGAGLSRPITGITSKLIAIINKQNKDIVSIDIASGLGYNGISKKNSAIIKPSRTISFQFPKLSFFLTENSPFVGQWDIVDIGLDKKIILAQPIHYHYITLIDIKKLIKPREKLAHKGVFGHTLLVGGSYGKIGAIILTSKACFRSGIGLVTTLLPLCGYQIMQTAIPEVMCLTSGNHYLEHTEIEDLDKYSSIAIGPGFGRKKSSLSLLTTLIKSSKKPMVIDADALNLIAENPALLSLIPKNSILTPHIGEFYRLMGVANNSIERLNMQKDFSIKYNLIVVLKGAYTSISTVEGTIWFNSTGNCGMATAGSGDVLTGIIASLLGQGYPPLEAAKISVFLHGKSGDIAKDKFGEYSLMASDIIEHISDTFLLVN